MAMEAISKVATADSIVSRDVLDTMTALRDRREPFAVATVIETQGSVSAKTGSKAVIGQDGRLAAGWIGGGCAEGSVCHAALGTLETGESTIVDLDLNDEVLGAGMPCGGTMRVFVEPFRPKPRLWILGHGKVSETLCAIGATIGFKVVVDDPMADPAHYPQAAQLFTEDFDYRRLDPQAEDCVVVATQHKGDHESMARCLRSPVPYIALIASRKRSKLVIDYLREQGFDEAKLARVHAPAGLDLGACKPEEIALSVLSEIVMLRHQASGAPRRRDGATAAIAIMRIDPSLTIAHLLDRHPAAMRLFIDRRIACVGCSVAPYHTIEEACAGYDLPVDGFMRKLVAIANRS